MDNLKNHKLSMVKTFEITSADIDYFGELSLNNLINFLLQSAVISADKLGFGMELMNQQNLFWVLSRMQLEMTDNKIDSNKVHIETWPKTIDGIYYIRDFIVRNSADEIVANCTSAWLAIDQVKRRPKFLHKDMQDVFTALNEKSAIKTFPEKLKKYEYDDNNYIDFEIFFSDLDMNKHLTTTRYVEMIMNNFDLDFLENNKPNKFIINFLKETKIKEKLRIYKKQISNNEYYIEGQNLTNEKTSFRSIISVCP